MVQLLTTNSEEATVSDLLDGANIFSIPYFQRPYKWEKERIRQFEEDIEKIADDEKLIHFLGAIIIHGRRHAPAQPKTFDVIDGQQRITTLFLFVVAASVIMSEYGLEDDAVDYLKTYVCLGRKGPGGSNFKLHSCKEDRRQVNAVIDDILGHSGLAVKLDNFRPEKLSDTGAPTGRVTKNYDAAKRFFDNFAETEGGNRVKEILDAMLERMSIVQIDVVDPTSGPKIFDSLNSRQEPMTIGDLVRNEIFARVSSLEPKEIDYVDEHSWQPFYQKFKVGSRNHFDAYFFPYGLIQNPNLSKSEVYSHLRDKWEKIKEPKQIIEQLAVYQEPFLSLLGGSNGGGWTGGIPQSIKRYHRFGFPASALPFLMQVLNGVSTGELDEPQATKILDVIESFLIRRAICGIEPTGLHALFRRLWVDSTPKITAEKVSEQIRKRVTVLWPDDAYVMEQIQTRPLYGSRVLPFLISEYDRSFGGDVPSDVPWIEHVLPQNPVAEWKSKFSQQQMDQFVNVWANLIPLSSAMNANISNDIYTKKRPKYKADSMFISARRFAEQFDDWTPLALAKRGKAIAQWAVKRWSY